MKRTVAFILSLTMIWLQMVAAAQTPAFGRTLSTKPECACCVPKGVCHCCCVTPTRPDAQPLPAIPAAPSSAADLNAAISPLLVWTVPMPAATIVSAPDCSVAPLAVPLFTRYCAFLI